MGEQTVRCKAVCGKMKPDELGGPRGRLAEKVAPLKDLKGERGPRGARRASAKAPGETCRECLREGWRGCVRAEVGVGGGNGHRDWRGLVPLSHSAFLPDPDGDAQEGLCRRWHVT